MSFAAIRHTLAIALSVFSLCACKGDADFGRVMTTPVTLNADEYRGEITGIDRLVFDEKPFGETRRAALAGKLDELAKRVKASSDSRFITIEVLELKRLAEVTHHSAEQAIVERFRR